MLLAATIGCALSIAAPPQRSKPGICSDYFGRGVANAGDIDGDGTPDLLVTAAGQNDPRTKRCRGAIFAFSGRDGSVIYTAWSDREFDRFGLCGRGSIAIVGDVNQDGVADFAETVSDAIRCTRDGQVLVQLSTEPSWDHAAHPIVGIGDCNGDLVPDLALTVSRARNFSVVRFLSGVDGALVREIRGSRGHEFGLALDSGVDVDGDGAFELLVGCPRGTEEERTRGGMVYCVSVASGEVLWDVGSRAPNDRFGYTVKWIGDVDGDGLSDFAVGAPGDVENWRSRPGECEYVRVFSGGNRAMLYTIEGPPNQDDSFYGSSFGRALDRARDVDVDGMPDFIVGAPRERGMSGSGRVYSGRSGELVHEFVGPGLSDWGACVGSAGDLNCDGRTELYIVALNDTLGAMPIGEVLVFDGRSGRELRRLQSPFTPRK
ncbi:MAG: integrin alpha [Planctomycetota bacterium]